MRIRDWSSDVCASDLAAPCWACAWARASTGRCPATATSTCACCRSSTSRRPPANCISEAAQPVVTKSPPCGGFFVPGPRRPGKRSAPGTCGPREKRCVCKLVRSEEHTSELQSLMRISYAVFCLKKKKSQCKTKVDRQPLHNITHDEAAAL